MLIKTLVIFFSDFPETPDSKLRTRKDGFTYFKSDTQTILAKVIAILKTIRPISLQFFLKTFIFFCSTWIKTCWIKCMVSFVYFFKNFIIIVFFTEFCFYFIVILRFLSKTLPPIYNFFAFCYFENWKMYF